LYAQQAVLGQMYGNGVHAYFSGDYVKSHQLLTAAADAGSRDPRCFYFRGLAYLRLGRPQEATADFQQGAKLESADLNKTYSVAKSLERIQGADRSEVEKYRVEARMAALEQAEKERKRRYEEMNREDRRQTEAAVGGPKPAASTPEPVAAPAPKPADDPFSTGPAAPGEKAAPTPAVEKPEAAAEPAAEVKKPAEAAAKSDDPFAAPAAKAEAEKPAAKPEGSEDPFSAPAKPAAKTAEPAAGAAAAPEKKHGFVGGVGRALGKAIGGGEAKEAKQGEEPAAKPAAKSGDADPFGGDAPAPAAGAKKKVAEKALSEDPFQDESAAKKPAAKAVEKKAVEKKDAAKKPAADPADPFGN
jgi:hypothetical protein